LGTKHKTKPHRTKPLTRQLPSKKAKSRLADWSTQTSGTGTGFGHDEFIGPWEKRRGRKK